MLLHTPSKPLQASCITIIVACVIPTRRKCRVDLALELLRGSDTSHHLISAASPLLQTAHQARVESLVSRFSIASQAQSPKLRDRSVAEWKFQELDGPLLLVDGAECSCTSRFRQFGVHGGDAVTAHVRPKLGSSDETRTPLSGFRPAHPALGGAGRYSDARRWPRTSCYSKAGKASGPKGPQCLRRKAAQTPFCVCSPLGGIRLNTFFFVALAWGAAPPSVFLGGVRDRPPQKNPHPPQKGVAGWGCV